MCKNTSKNFGILFLGTIFWLPHAKFCCIVVLLQLGRYYRAGKATGNP